MPVVLATLSKISMNDITKISDGEDETMCVHELQRSRGDIAEADTFFGAGCYVFFLV